MSEVLSSIPEDPTPPGGELRRVKSEPPGRSAFTVVRADSGATGHVRTDSGATVLHVRTDSRASGSVRTDSRASGSDDDSRASDFGDADVSEFGATAVGATAVGATAVGATAVAPPSADAAAVAPPSAAATAMAAAPADLAVKNAIDKIVAEIRGAVELKNVTAQDVGTVLGVVMGLVERLRGLSGPQKKVVAVHVVRLLVAEIPGTPEQKAGLGAAVDLLLPPLIDTVVAATLGRLDVNGDGRISGAEGSAFIRSCFPCCFPSAA